MSNLRRKYDEKFKKRVVSMSYSSKRPFTAVAESLGITSNTIYPLAEKGRCPKVRGN